MNDLLTVALAQFTAQIDKLESESDSRYLNILGNLIYDLWESIYCEHMPAHKRTTPGILEIAQRWQAQQAQQ